MGNDRVLGRIEVVSKNEGSVADETPATQLVRKQAAARTSIGQNRTHPHGYS
jgi:hypothetical protein